MSFLGFDHVDARVPSLRDAEPFYSALLPALGLTIKSFVRIEFHGDDDEWIAVDATDAYNALEFHEPDPAPGYPPRFMGVIEQTDMQASPTRIAFALPPDPDLDAWAARLRAWGARKVELSADPIDYPAIFFEDPFGSKFELCARRPRT